ncbi:Bug family tripartite tricarboxylate transporter substrate binding protein [Caldimonas tepidiphila]|uniref:Bug family tripartite tricarboxylate transporter substrate binding protein n=1 Tax=Caldimonas tepidiphila TaxID=2315841 RepID=UPI000E5B2B2E|nr:tripartite tricarboxylate transporter substrate binding protein [Caldimonas tepidiphila]
MLRRTLLAATLLAAPLLALAQSYPDRPLKLTVGFPPGTGPDIVARVLGQKIEQLAKQSVVVDNRAGAGGQIAAQTVAKSPADGYSLLLGEVGSISIAPAAYSRLPYDPAKELVPVSEVVRSDFVLVVPATSPARDVKGFVEHARAQRDRLNFATFGAGTPGHFGAEVFAEQAGFKVEPVHYRATGDAITALIAGDMHGAFVSTALAVPQLKSGKMRALATTAQTRSPLLPDVPTFAEAGWPKVDFSAWFGVFAPAGTPAAALDTLNRHVVAAMQSSDVKQKLQDAGFTVLGSSRADAERMVKAEAPRWAAIVKASGFRGD